MRSRSANRLPASLSDPKLPLCHRTAPARREPWNPHRLRQHQPEWLPAVADLHARLQGDPPTHVADIGSGAGWSVIALARAYTSASASTLGRAFRAWMNAVK